MKNYPHFISMVTSTPWMMLPSSLKMMLNILEAHLSGNMSVEDIKIRMQAVQQRNGDGELHRQGTVAVLPLQGAIFPKANLMTEFSGGVSLDQWSKQLSDLVEDDAIGSIVLDIDSPGGSSSMIPEVMSQIRESREVKPIYAVANVMAASAAYGLASQATKIYATQSGVAGSVGTYFVHTDDSRMVEAQGVTETVIKEGRFKAYDFESLTPESKEAFQEWVGDVNDQFVNGIAQGRGIDPNYVRSNYGEGKVFAADRALSSGLIDGIATLSEVVGHAIEGGNTVAVAVPGSRQSYDADKEHSEPGTGLGGEPTPRTPPEEGDPAIEGGWRRDPPPPAYETEEAVNRAWLETQATALGISFDEKLSDEDLSTSVSQQIEEIVVPLNSATAEATRQIEFAQAYPEQAARLERLEVRDRETEAQSFAESFARFENDPKHGFSTVIRDKIAEAHSKIGVRQFTHTDLKELLDLTASQTAKVAWGEEGSSRQGESSERVSPTQDFRHDRKQFADMVQSAMKEDNLSRDAAIAHVSEQNPELAAAYLSGHVR